MKTISTHLNLNNKGFNHSLTRKNSYKNLKYSQYYNQAAGDINRNATISQAEYQRDACEEELYRLRYGIENLLANKEQGDFRQRQRFTNLQNPVRTMLNKIIDYNYKDNENWVEQCSPCCRRSRRNRYDDNAYHRAYDERNYDLPTRRTPESSIQPQVYNDTYMSTPPSPSISSRYIDSNTMNYRKNNLRESIDDLINQNTPNRADILDLLSSKGMNDPVYNSLIIRILEAKALDCLCTGYSKENTHKQISRALTELNQRIDENQSDSTSVTSSSSLADSYESSSPSLSPSSSSISSILTNDESISSHSITPQLYSPLSSSIQTPFQDQMTSPIGSPLNSKGSLKFNEDNQTPNKQSKVTILTDKTSRSHKLKKKPTSKHRKQSSSKHPKKPFSKHRKQSSSKHRKQSSSKHRKKPSKSQKSSKKHHSSKSRHKKHSSKSPSRSKTSRQHKSKHTKTHKKKKRTKPKSNNQINDHETILSPTFIYPQLYQKMYRNRQKLLLSSI